MNALFKPQLKTIWILILGYSLLNIISIFLTPNFINIPTSLPLILILYLGYCFYHYFYGKYATITRTLPIAQKNVFKTFLRYIIGFCFLIAFIFTIISIIDIYTSPEVSEYADKTIHELVIWFSYVGFTSFCGYLLTISAFMLMISILYSNIFKIKNKYIILISIAVFCFFLSFWIYLFGILTNIFSLLLSALAFWLTFYLYTKHSIIQT